MLFETGLEFGESFQRLLLQRGGIAGDVGFSRSLDMWQTPVEGCDQLTDVTDLLLRFVVVSCIEHRWFPLA